MGLEADRDPTSGSIEEVMLQGIGFALRPISTVPLTATPPIDDGVISEGFPMQWMGDWNQGLYYPQGAFVRDGDVTAVANKLTLEKPAPVTDPADPESYGLPTYTPTTESNVSVVVSGNTYTFAQDGWVKELRIWVTDLTATTNYRILIVDLTDPTSPVTTTIEEPVLTADAWKIIALLNKTITAGSVFRISIDALNTGADTNISGGWAYQGPTQAGAPFLQNWTQDNQRTSFRIDKTDLDGTDRSTELEGVIPETSISVVETANVGNTVSYRVATVVDSGTFMTFGVVLQTETGIITTGAVCTLDIDIPIALATEYAQELLVWGTPPSWATSVEGFLEYDGVDQGVPTTNAYGVDILFEPASVSEDWDIVSFTG